MALRCSKGDRVKNSRSQDCQAGKGIPGHSGALLPMDSWFTELAKPLYKATKKYIQIYMDGRETKGV